MFDFMDMLGTYDSRKIGRYEQDGLLVSTCAVTDSDKPYETAVAHPLYNGGDIVIVEMYDTKEQAKDGHKKWVRRMRVAPEDLPLELKDVSKATIAKMVFGEKQVNEVYRKGKR